LGVIQGTLGVIQGTLGVIQGTLSVIQGTQGVIQGTQGVIQETHIIRVLLHIYIDNIYTSIYIIITTNRLMNQWCSKSAHSVSDVRSHLIR